MSLILDFKESSGSFCNHIRPGDGETGTKDSKEVVESVETGTGGTTTRNLHGSW